MTGYKNLPSSDPEETRLRVEWYATKMAAEAPGSTLQQREDHKTAHGRLTKYLWERLEGEIAEDRRKHPKAKRNQTFQGPEIGMGRSIK